SPPRRGSIRRPDQHRRGDGLAGRGRGGASRAPQGPRRCRGRSPGSGVGPARRRVGRPSRSLRPPLARRAAGVRRAHAPPLRRTARAHLGGTAPENRLGQASACCVAAGLNGNRLRLSSVGEQVSMVDERTTVILGSGPAGYTAALYAARANLRPVLVKGLEAGGQLMLTTDVENYPGFPDGILGPEMMDAFEKQAARFETEIVAQTVTRVDLSERPFGVWAGDLEWRAQTLILATGASARWLGVPGEETLRGRGVSACATCDGFFFRDRELVVVGGGDTAMEEATFLTKFASKVTIVHRRDEFRASPIMVDRALANPKIEVIWDTVVDEIAGDDAVTGVTLHDVKTDEQRAFATDGVFMAIGHTPNTKLFEGQLELQDGYIQVDEPRTSTNVPGVFAAGDVTDTIYRQAVTAAGQGCKAAIDAERFLEAEAHAG